MLCTKEWLPMGSVVHVAGAVLPHVVIACMVRDEDGRLWDYAGVAYPQGLVEADGVVLFDRDSLEGVRYLGFMNEDGEAYLGAVGAAEAGYLESKRLGEGPGADGAPSATGDVGMGAAGAPPADGAAERDVGPDGAPSATGDVGLGAGPDGAPSAADVAGLDAAGVPSAVGAVGRVREGVAG